MSGARASGRPTSIRRQQRGYSHFRNQGGYLLLAVAVTLAVIAAAAFLINRESALLVQVSSGGVDATQVDYVAQAGLHHALWQTNASACAGDITIPSSAFGPHSYDATITAGGTTTAYSLSVDQDAWIRNDQPTINNGTNADQHIRFESGNVEQALFRFDLSSLPAGAQINSASAWFYVTSAGPGGGAHPEGALTVHRVNADWTEAGVTWDNANGSFDSQVLAMIPAQPQDDVWVRVNITAQVQAWVNGQPNYGIMLGSTSEGVHAKYVSREGTAGQQPRLDVVVGTGASSPANIQATGTLVNGVTRTLSRPITPAYQPPGSVTLQLGPDPGADAMLDNFYPRNYGGRDFVQLNGDPSWLQRPVLRFDLAGVPEGASVLSARLELRMRSLVAPGTATVHRVTRSWVEGTKSGTGQPDGATWATYDGTNNWTSTGGDFNASAVAETAIDSTDTWVSWEIGPLVEQWLAGEPNDGLLIQADGALREAEFFTQEEADATVRPKLTITYACECGSACLAPQGSGNVLMVVGDDDPLAMHPEDALKRDILESWGYTVTLLQDNISQTAYNNAVASNDVVYVSETASSAAVGNKLTNVAIGVVNEQGNLNDELGMASARANPVGSSIDIVDNGHYITLPFSAGALDIYAAAMEGLTVSGTEAAGLQTLADRASAGTLVVLDQGAQMTSGGTAAGPRVMLPLGRSTNSNFTWTHLNSNGRLIVQRALQWGTGNIGAAPGQNLLLVLVDPSNLTTQEAAKKALIESWGYTVNLIDESDTQTAFDMAVAANDVVFITEDVTASNINTKLVNATIGVVTEEANLADEFGISSTIGWSSGTTIDIKDPPHYITEPFGKGNLTIFTASESRAQMNGDLAGDLLRLAAVDPDPALVALETGAALHSGMGGNAAGRRVLLPWGGNDMDVNHLNADGLTLFQRALEWGAGAGSVAGTPTFWVSTEGDVSSSGAPGLDAWADGETLELADPNLALEPGNTDGTFASMFNLDDFASDSDADIDALHYVSTDITVGGANSFDLKTGDVLLSITGGDVDYTETLNGTGPNQLTVKEEDVFVFRPDTSGDYSAGRFYMLLDMDPVWSNDTRGVTLVEQQTDVGDATLQAGTFLLTQQGNYRIWHFDAANVGAGTTSGTAVIFIDGGDLNFGTQPWGVELVESATTIGGDTLQPGQILVTLRHDNKTVGNTGPAANVEAEDIFYLDVTQTGATTVASATLLLEGLDVNLDTSQEHLQALTLTNSSSGGGGTGPLAHWKLDDGSGSVAVDSVGGHDGTLVSTPAWVAGKLGDALDFDGVDDYVDVGTFDVSGSGLTLMGWVNAETIPTSDGRIISKASGPNATDAFWQLSTTDSGSNRYLRMRIRAGGTTTTFADSSVNLTTGQWYFAVGTYDNATGEMKLYLDGVEVASGIHAVGGPVDTNPAVPVAIGANGTAERYFDGVLDDVRIYDRALSAAEVADLFSAGGGGSGGSGGVVFEEFTDAKANAATSLSISKPPGTVAGDLLIAALVTDGSTSGSMSPPAGWNVVDLGEQNGRVTFGVWWKLAGASESASYSFSWGGGEKVFGMVMRFTGHDPGSPIHVSSAAGGSSSAPPSPAVTTTVTDTMILRLGGFDDDDITVGDPGLPGHAAITMDESSNGSGTSSAGAGYLMQATAGDSGTSTFSLTATEEYRSVTIAIAPAP